MDFYTTAINSGWRFEPRGVFCCRATGRSNRCCFHTESCDLTDEDVGRSDLQYVTDQRVGFIQRMRTEWASAFERLPDGLLYHEELPENPSEPWTSSLSLWWRINAAKALKISRYLCLNSLFLDRSAQQGVSQPQSSCSTGHRVQLGQLRASGLCVGLALMIISAAWFQLRAEGLQQLPDNWDLHSDRAEGPAENPCCFHRLKTLNKSSLSVRNLLYLNCFHSFTLFHLIGQTSLTRLL